MLDIVEYNIQDLYEQGRHNICKGLFKDQSDETLYPKEFEKTSLHEIESFMNKLVVLAPTESFIKDGLKNFRVLQSIETGDNNKITLYNTQKLDKFGIKVYLDEDGEYAVHVKDKEYGRFMCTPNTIEIMLCVYSHMLSTFSLPSRRIYTKFYNTLQKTLTQ